MSRHSLEIRDASPADAARLLELWSGVGRAEAGAPSSLDEAAAALAQTAADPDERFLVGLHEGVIVAALHLRRAAISPLHSDMAIHTSYLLVAPEHRKHGFARALLDAALTCAEEKDVSLVSSYNASSSRDTSRFLARLGFAPVASVRIANTGLLRRKLTPEAIRPLGGRSNLGRVLAERRALRRLADD
jgi:GNAT superfamily N-acetyltransferase